MATAPKHLRPATRKWWKSVVDEWSLDEHHIMLLTLAAEAWDRGQDARERIKQEGVTVTNRHNETVAHPCVAVERDSAIRFSRLVRELDLDSDVSQPSRPPALKSNRPLASIRGGRRAS